MPRMSKETAMRRIHWSGLTIAYCLNMTDAQLLAYPYIGRKTLHFIRNFQLLET